jgi:hypothetical protein
MSPLEFMQRLAALVPRPRLHLIGFHGVIAPNAKLRAAVVPVPAQTTTKDAGDCTQSGRHERRSDRHRACACHRSEDANRTDKERVSLFTNILTRPPTTSNLHLAT